MDVLIGVAWPYASGPRHLGHLAGAYLPADVAARHHRLAGDRVLLVSGSDQHGTPITVAAERAGLTPAALADREHERIAASFARAGISFDHYTRTATPRHHAVTQDLFTRLHRRGLVTEATQPAAFCAREARSLPDRYVEGTCPSCGAPDARGDQCDTCGRTLDPEALGEPRCRRCGGPAELRTLRQLFLRLDLLQPEVARYLDGHETGWRPFVGAEARGWLASGLRPRAITRDLDWGVPVPLPCRDDRRLYVWFDAVIGYLSASLEWAEGTGEPDAWRRWWQGPEARHRYFVGKDNIWFHTVWWPAILLGAGQGLRPPDEVVANHHLTRSSGGPPRRAPGPPLAGGKLSASRGHAPTIEEGIERVGLDPLRHALCALGPETADVELAWTSSPSSRPAACSGPSPAAPPGGHPAVAPLRRPARPGRPGRGRARAGRGRRRPGRGGSGHRPGRAGPRPLRRPRHRPRRQPPPGRDRALAPPRPRGPSRADPPAPAAGRPRRGRLAVRPGHGRPGAVPARPSRRTGRLGARPEPAGGDGPAGPPAPPLPR
jgi:methionyl-tRNA synthetase